MNISNRNIWIAAGVVIACGIVVLVGVVAFGLGRANNPPPLPTIDLFATLSASTPVPASSPAPSILTPTPTSLFDFSDTQQPDPKSSATNVPTPSTGDGPTGRIVFTCQIYKYRSADQICIMNADGSGYRRLTTDDGKRHFYPSLSPDGSKVLYAAFREENVYEIYKYDLEDSRADRLTSRLGVLTAPEYSPDGSNIAFTRWTVSSNKHRIMLMEANGADPNNIPGAEGWDPTWSPDGKQILFASDRNGDVQLFAVKDNGKGLHQVSDLPAIRGRSDWSVQGQIVTYSGPSWHRELYIMKADGSEARQLTPTGGNSQGPSFSPDGKWVAFTAYFDKYDDIHGCEIYIIRTDGTDLRRLTNNDYCDYQPRWGP